MRRIAAAAAMAAVLVTVPYASRAQDANEACPSGQGVTLVVDFGSLGGGVNLRCASQPVSNGYDVFRQTHVSYETVSDKDFICRIAGTPADLGCADYPPGDYYWAYWWAKPGGEWQYANKGAGAHKPTTGAYEGWSFVSSDTATPPRYPPPHAPPTTTNTTRAASAPPGASPATTSPPVPPTTPRGRGSDASRVTTPPTTGPSGETAPPPSAAYAIDPSPSTSIALGHVDLSRSAKGSGTSLGFILSGLAVVSAGALAFAFARTRGR